MGEKTLASANVGSYSPYDEQPLVGINNINKDVDYSKEKSFQYL